MLNEYRLQIKYNRNSPNHDKTAPQDSLSPERLMLEALFSVDYLFHLPVLDVPAQAEHANKPDRLSYSIPSRPPERFRGLSNAAETDR